MPVALFAVQHTELGIGIVIAVVLAAALLVPYLVNEIRRGKAELGPQLKQTSHGVEFGAITPPGAGDNRAGRVGNPAPNEPDAQADPYSREAQKNGPPIQS